MTPPQSLRGYRTRSELALAQLECLKRPLTDEESDRLRRALHAVYCRNRRLRIEQEWEAPALEEYARTEASTLERAEREMGA